ncbi:MAG: NUDIX hydrolase [Pseudomonadales bacterium]|nr:NUDIX hydrolase [Pseudomonadales bacterium]
MKNSLASLLVLGIIASTSCGEVPRCTYAGEFKVEANAGCLVINQNRLLIVEDYLGQMSLPGGTKSSGEAPQCTAEREVWEETGIRVSAGRKIRTLEKGFQVYDCEIFGEQLLDGSMRPAFSEIKNIHWLELNQFDQADWRFPGQVSLMKQHLRNHSAKTKNSL